MKKGRLAITVAGKTYDLQAGDCLRYQLFDSNVFSTPDDKGAEYLLFIV